MRYLVALALISLLSGCGFVSDVIKYGGGGGGGGIGGGSAYYPSPFSTGQSEIMRPNAYGPGIHMDQYGAPVRVTPAR